MGHLACQHLGNIPDHAWEAAAASGKVACRRGRQGGGAGRDVPPRSPSRCCRRFGHTSAHATAAVLKAQKPGPAQPASSKLAISSSYSMDRPAGRGGGRSGRSHSFRCRRIFAMTGLSPIRLMILSGPEQRGQTSGCAWYTFLINRAHERLRARANTSPLSESCWRRGCGSAG